MCLGFFGGQMVNSMSSNVGATSSPRVANFCLKTTASIYGTEFDPDVVQTIERNIMWMI